MSLQKQSKSEARHEKQKQKLLAKNVNVEVAPKKIDNSMKMQVYDAALALNYECVLDNGSILMFKQKDKKVVTQWLLDKYGKEENGIIKIPFSYGFN